MRVNEYGQILRTEQEVIDLLYQNPELDIKSINVDSQLVDRFNQSANLCEVDVCLKHLESITDNITEFDRKNQQDWFLPEEYKNFKIVEFLLDKTENEEQYSRVVQELDLYVQYDMFDLLIYLKYLVDTLRAQNIVWGVGRGSSVASHCLYLIGVHKVNSMQYNLDIHEFLK
jgi:DNA polymerase III alpha subunit